MFSTRILPRFCCFVEVEVETEKFQVFKLSWAAVLKAYDALNIDFCLANKLAESISVFRDQLPDLRQTVFL